eukprot:m.101103 g.101103  ORF g.101103 m.101103 type:complete len:628 (-) comp15645_c0_seq1:76-1959(-)
MSEKYLQATRVLKTKTSPPSLCGDRGGRFPLDGGHKVLGPLRQGAAEHRRVADEDDRLAMRSQPPHAAVEAPRIQVPQVPALGQVHPRAPVVLLGHGDGQDEGAAIHVLWVLALARCCCDVAVKSEKVRVARVLAAGESCCAARCCACIAEVFVAVVLTLHSSWWSSGSRRRLLLQQDGACLDAPPQVSVVGVVRDAVEAGHGHACGVRDCMLGKVGHVEVRVHVDTGCAKVEGARDLGDDALAALAHARRPHPHVPVPLLVEARPVGLELRLVQGAAQQPTQAGHRVHAQQRCWVTHPALLTQVVPGRHAVDGRVGCRSRQQLRKVLKVVGRGVDVLLMHNGELCRRVLVKGSGEAGLVVLGNARVLFAECDFGCHIDAEEAGNVHGFGATAIDVHADHVLVDALCREEGRQRAEEVVRPAVACNDHHGHVVQTTVWLARGERERQRILAVAHAAVALVHGAEPHPLGIVAAPRARVICPNGDDGGDPCRAAPLRHGLGLRQRLPRVEVGGALEEDHGPHVAVGKLGDLLRSVLRDSDSASFRQAEAALVADSQHDDAVVVDVAQEVNELQLRVADKGVEDARRDHAAGYWVDDRDHDTAVPLLAYPPGDLYSLLAVDLHPRLQPA